MSDNKCFRECGPGWNSLIDPLEALVEELRGNVNQIKEKFAQLRFYYDSGATFDDPRWGVVERRVEEAERKSREVCEMCGAPGILMTTGSWLKTLCADDALSLGFRKKAQT
jgi:hypothetical protein